MRALWVLSIGLRLLAAAVLLVGPWTDDATELNGWDSERFQAIAEHDGTHYRDFEVEYPPGSVVLIEALAADDVVGTNRRLVLGSLAVDLGLAALLAKRWRPAAGLSYLLLGLPLVPTGLLRFDLWSAFAAVVALAAVTDDARNRTRAGLFAVATTVGALIKLWPVLLIPAVVAVGHRRPALAATGLGAVAGAVWLVVGGIGAIDQVTSLRGATGWHVESVPGSLTALFGEGEAVRQADAFRIGTLNETIVLFGRIVAVAVTLGLVRLGHKLWAVSPPSDARDIAPIIMLGSVAALLVTSPLLSPQFLLWLTPWAAMLRWSDYRALIAATAASIIVTAGTLAAFGPPNVDQGLAAALLLIRDALLIGIVMIAGWTLRAARAARRDQGVSA